MKAINISSAGVLSLPPTCLYTIAPVIVPQSNPVQVILEAVHSTQLSVSFCETALPVRSFRVYPVPDASLFPTSIALET